MTYKFACSHPETVAAIAGLAGAMDSDPASCGATTPVSVLHIHGTDDATIYYSGGSIFSNVYTGAEQSALRWAGIDKCSLTPTINPAFDLVSSIQGLETIPTVYSCPTSTVELWSINSGSHGPVVDSSFGLQVIDWLLAHPKK